MIQQVFNVAKLVFNCNGRYPWQSWLKLVKLNWHLKELQDQTNPCRSTARSNQSLLNETMHASELPGKYVLHECSLMSTCSAA